MDISGQIDKVPETIGSYTFYDGSSAVYSGFAANIAKSLRYLEGIKNHNEVVQRIFEQSSLLDWKDHPTLYDAFLDTLFRPGKEQIPIWENYIYLAVDFWNPPFFKITETTVGEEWYIGPFRNRFFLSDFLMTMNKLFHTPICESKTYPCKLHETGECDGWCIQQLSSSSAGKYFRFFLFPDKKIIIELKNRREQMMDELRFEESELLGKQIEVLEKYQDWLYSLCVTSGLDFDMPHGSNIHQIRGGRLQSILHDDIPVLQRPLRQIPQRPNESMAVDKSEIDERRVIWKHLEKTNENRVTSILQVASVHMQQTLEKWLKENNNPRGKVHE